MFCRKFSLSKTVALGDGNFHLNHILMKQNEHAQLLIIPHLGTKQNTTTSLFKKGVRTSTLSTCPCEDRFVLYFVGTQ